MHNIELKRPSEIPQSLYWSTTYLTPNRFSSIGLQWKLAVELDCVSYLEIGIGNGILTELLRAKGYQVSTLDINKNLHPMIVGSLPLLPFSTNAFEVSLCYEVLEHLPFDLFSVCLKEITRVTSHYVILSLPDQNTMANGLKQHVTVFMNSIINSKSVLPDEHFWEIGYGGLKATDIDDLAIAAGLSPLKHFRNPLLPYHHFFLFAMSANEK